MEALKTTAPAQKDRKQLRLGVLFLATLLIVSAALVGCGGSVSTTEVQPSGDSSGTATLAWSAPTTNADGTPLTTLAGYKVYYGTTPGAYTSLVVGDVNSYQINGLTKGQTYYFTVTAYDTYGIESDYAPEASKVIS